MKGAVEEVKPWTEKHVHEAKAALYRLTAEDAASGDSERARGTASAVTWKSSTATLGGFVDALMRIEKPHVDAVVHRRPIGRDPAKSAAARVGGFARAQRLTPARRQEIGRIACNAGLAALAPRFAEAARRLEANVAEIELAIKDAAKNGQRFSAAKYIDLQDWPNEGKVHARFKEKHGLSCRAFYEVCARDAWRPQ